MTDSDNNMYLTADSMIEINNLITGSNNITLRNVNVKPYGFDKIYMYTNLIEDKLYQIIYQFTKMKITPVKLYSILLHEIHQFCDGNGTTCKNLFPNDDKIKRNVNIKSMNAQCLHSHKNTELPCSYD